jgi:uncharacterized membrane protein
MLRTDVRDIPHIAKMQDESAGLVLGMVIFGCLASILAILIELTSLKHLTGSPRVLHLLLTGTTLAVSGLTAHLICDALRSSPLPAPN